MSPTPWLLSIGLAWLGQSGPSRAPVFETDILPLLDRRCTECHGISKQSSGLRLDSFARLQKGGKNGPVIVPGKSGGSRLLELVLGEGKKRMPPKGDRVPPGEVDLIRRWIDGGALSGPLEPEGEREVRLEKLPAGYAPILAVAGDRDGKRLALGSGSAVMVVRLEAGAAAPAGGGEGVEAVLEGHADLVQSLAFSPDGKVLAAGVFREVLLWDTGSFTLRRKLGPHADRVLALDWSPDGGLLAAGGGNPSRSGEIAIWQAGTGKLMRRFPEVHTDTVFSVDWSPDGARLATGSADRMAHVLDVASGSRLLRLEGHTHHVLSVAFSADGKKLLSAGADGKIKSWNLESGQPIKDWNGHQKAVTGLSFSPDGKFAASVSADRTARIWNPDGGQLKSYAEARDYLHAVSVFAGGKLVAVAGGEPVVRIYESGGEKPVRVVSTRP